jgi:hypothetical protein
LVAKYSEKLLKNLIDTKSISSSINLSNHNIFEEASVYPIIINGHLNKSPVFTKYNIEKLEDFIMYGTLIKENPLKVYPTLKDFGFKIQGGLAGFQANSIKEFLSVEKTSDNIEFTVSGGIDKYTYNNNNIRYMGERYDHSYIEKQCNLSAEKMKFWLNPKVIIAGMTKQIESVYTKNSVGLGVGVYGIQELTDEQGYMLTAILNSKFISQYFQEKFKEKSLAGGYLAINKNTIEEIPFINPDDKMKVNLINLSMKIHKIKAEDSKTDTQVLEQEIDTMVYELYGLSAEEIGIVEGS